MHEKLVQLICVCLNCKPDEVSLEAKVLQAQAHPHRQGVVHCSLHCVADAPQAVPASLPEKVPTAHCLHAGLMPRMATHLEMAQPRVGTQVRTW